MLSIAVHALRRRRTSLIWWALGVAGMAALLAVAYPTIRDNNELDKTFGSLPPGVEALLGLSGGNTLTSPAGYLDSQFFANILPVMLLVFAIGVAAWSVAGDEQSGTLELLLANPIGRVPVALARFAALVAMLAVLVAVGVATLVGLAPTTGLNKGLPADKLAAATIGAGLLALAFAAVAFAVGAAPSRWASRPRWPWPGTCWRDSANRSGRCTPPDWSTRGTGCSPPTPPGTA
jgi:beta-exotoxin I transport system permease protein